MARSYKITEAVSLQSRGNGVWRTSDGRFEVNKQEYEETCDDQHPARLTVTSRAFLRQEVNTRGYLPAQNMYGGEAIIAALDGKPGYLCPGYMSHIREYWIAWDLEMGDYLNGDQDPSEKLADQLDRLRRWYAKQG
jgi:hypothetical protein